MKILIFCFSGTGNTWWIVKQFENMAVQDNHEVFLYSIEKIDKNNVELIRNQWINSDIIGFAYPIYGSDVPKIMKQFVSDLPKYFSLDSFPKKNAFVFTSMALFSGDGGSKLNKYLKKINLQVLNVYNFKMTSNLGIPLFNYNPVSKEKFEKRKIDALEKLKKQYDNVIQGKKSIQNRYNPFSYFFGWLQRVGMGSVENNNSKYLDIDSSRCTKCLLCVKNCPTQSIIYNNDEFTFNSTCTACYRCYNFCPTQAVRIFKRAANPKHHLQHTEFKNGNYIHKNEN